MPRFWTRPIFKIFYLDVFFGIAEFLPLRYKYISATLRNPIDVSTDRPTINWIRLRVCTSKYALKKFEDVFIFKPFYL